MGYSGQLYIAIFIIPDIYTATRWLQWGLRQPRSRECKFSILFYIVYALLIKTYHVFLVWLSLSNNFSLKGKKNFKKKKNQTHSHDRI